MPLSRAFVPHRPLIVATGNPGKLHELRALLEDLPFDLHGLGELKVAAPEESGATFLENALLKARHAAAAALPRPRWPPSPTTPDSKSTHLAAHRASFRRATPGSAPMTLPTTQN